MDSTNLPQMRTTTEISKEFEISPYTIRQWCREDHRFHVLVGRKILINRDRFVEFLNGSLLRSAE